MATTPAKSAQKKEELSRDARALSQLAATISTEIASHDKISGNLLVIVNQRLANLETMAASVEKLRKRLGPGITADTDRLLRKLKDDISANLRLTASMRVPLQRGPSLKNYTLMVGE